MRAVNDHLSQRRQTEVGYTTTLKMLQLMLEKGLVRRDDRIDVLHDVQDLHGHRTRQRELAALASSTEPCAHRRRTRCR